MYIKTFEQFKPLSYSGGDVEKMPIIGTLVTRELKMGEHVIPSAMYNVVEIIEDTNGEIYVVDKWYKSRVPQLIHVNLVEKYTPKK